MGKRLCMENGNPVNLVILQGGLSAVNNFRPVWFPDVFRSRVLMLCGCAVNYWEGE